MSLESDGCSYFSQYKEVLTQPKLNQLSMGLKQAGFTLIIRSFLIFKGLADFTITSCNLVFEC
jgi:hypothetical protein